MVPIGPDVQKTTQDQEWPKTGYEFFFPFLMRKTGYDKNFLGHIEHFSERPPKKKKKTQTSLVLVLGLGHIGLRLPH